jgi:hypothetical protein|tara:strand:+ start:77 stop:466 length:390 start_codon:yes stop_codon:yes gene_type:complete
MKKILLILLVAMSFTSCENDITEPTYNIEGKWTFGGVNPNTMYLYNDGVRYTYYCAYADCREYFRESCEAGDSNSLPETNNYTFENGILTVDLNFGDELVTPITFECNGGRAIFQTPNYNLYELNSNCE